MACGTGKSLVSIWAAERLDASNVLVLVPTIALVRQVTREWAENAATRRRLLQICSDSSKLPEEWTRGDELAMLRTTDPAALADRLRSGAPLLVVSTYDSSAMLAEAMRDASGFEFDLAIADEAHRCAGLAGTAERTILDEDAIRARRRLFLTATPTVYGTRDKHRVARKNVRVASMDDRALFGPVVYRLSFAEAIAEGLLCPYQVAVIPIDDEEVHRLIRERRIVTADGQHNLEAGRLATEIACARAMRRFGCRRLVAFHPTIPESRRFSSHFRTAAGLLHDDERPDGPVWSEHVDGDKMSHARRTQILERFTAPVPAESRILSNVRLLTEGVDVPGIDAIAFVDTRRGQTSVIQAVGRAMRVAPGKTVGTVVLPVVLRRGEDFGRALARSEHRAVVDILGALRSHDPDIVKSLDELRFNVNPHEPRSRGHGRFVIDAPTHVGEEFAEAVDVALANALGLSEAHARRRLRRSGSASVATVTLGNPQPTPEQAFYTGLQELLNASRWDLLPAVPRDIRGFPMHAWWDEAMRRWAAGELDGDIRQQIADGISWLSEDLTGFEAQRREISRITRADVVEQVLVQLGTGGVFRDAQFAPIADEGDLEEPLEIALDAITHPGMSPMMRLHYLMAALRLVTPAMLRAREKGESELWYSTSSYRPVLDGFAHALEVARLSTSPFDRPGTPWSAGSAPRAFALGKEAAIPLERLAWRMRAYRFPDDEHVVAQRRAKEQGLPPDCRLDALGWDVYLLAQARGTREPEALRLALEGTLRQRKAVRAELLRSALRLFRRQMILVSDCASLR